MIELGLARISRLVRTQPLWKSVHVAGTNGKGSICSYLSAMLHASGVRCGRFTSPHLIDRWDCITIDELPVRESTFREAEAAIRQINKVERIGATEFELLTATAFEIFARENIELGVVETGLGGRLDATNVLDNKVATVISKIGLDHQKFLGDTIEEITEHKAGIMRRGVPCVVDQSNPSAVMKVVKEHARKLGTDIILSSNDSTLLDDLSEQRFEPHQLENLACAYTAFHLAYTKTNSPLHRILPAIQSLQWPGRLQSIAIRSVTGRREMVLLDGAHNPQAAEVLGTYVNDKLRPSNGRITWVFAASNGKELDGILQPLLRTGDACAAVEFGRVDGMPWVQPMKSGSILSAAAVHGIDRAQLFDAGNNLSGVLNWASEAAAGGPIVIAGSLYLVSDVLRLLRSAKTLVDSL